MCHEKKCSCAKPVAEALTDDEVDIESFFGRDRTGIPLGLEIRLDSGVSSKALLEIIRRLVRAGGLYQRALAYYVLLFYRRGEHRFYGSRKFMQCAVTLLDLTENYAKELIRVGTKLEDFKLLDAAFLDGILNWSKVREIVRIATPETEHAWIEYARNHNAREVQAAVRGLSEGDLPPKDGAGDLGTPRTIFRILLAVTVGARCFLAPISGGEIRPTLRQNLFFAAPTEGGLLGRPSSTGSMRSTRS
jgi:hypothetical protein